MKIDNTKTEYLNILEHINQLLPTGKRILEGEVRFSDPRVIGHEDLSLIPLDNPNGSYINNTEITVTPIGRIAWENPTQVQYRRIHLLEQYLLWMREGKGREDNPITYTLPKEKTHSREEEKEAVLDYLLSLLPFLRKASLQVEGGFTTPLSEERDERASFKVIPIDNSLLYEGELVFNVLRVKGESFIPPPPKEKIDLVEIYTPTKMDNNNTKANEGDGFDYDEEVQGE